jgi:predicted MFS family arabinose efflux permease
MSTRGVFFGWWVALSFAVMAFISSGIRFAVGPFLKPMVADLSDRLGRRPVLTWVYGTRALIFLALLLVRDQPLVLLLIAFVGGASMSGSLAAASALSAEIFGRLSVGSVYGTMFLFHQTGSALGSWLSGALFEATGGYGAAFGVATALLLGASALSATIGERPRPVAEASRGRRGRAVGVPRNAEASEGASRPF